MAEIIIFTILLIIFVVETHQWFMTDEEEKFFYNSECSEDDNHFSEDTNSDDIEYYDASADVDWNDKGVEESVPVNDSSVVNIDNDMAFEEDSDPLDDLLDLDSLVEEITGTSSKKAQDDSVDVDDDGLLVF